MARKIRVGVNGHDLKFWCPLQRALEATGRYEFREDVWTGHDTHDPAQSQAMLEWADIIIAEWALGNAVYYAANKRPGQKLYVRLHAQERRTSYPERIDFDKVDAVVFVGRHVLDECVEKFGIPRPKCTVIGNFVDVAKFRQSKFGGSEFVLGMIGTAPASKRLDLALDTLELLLERDDRYCLRVKGASPASINWLWARSAEREYYERVYERINSSSLRYKVIFDPRGNDVHHWLKLVGTILSPSDHESFHMAVAEGAASGALPIVWAWPGAADIYPEFPLVRTPQEAAEAINFNNRSTAGHRMREQASRIIAMRYDAAVISSEWDRLLSGFPDLQVGRPARRIGRDVLVVWAIDGWSTFHRREMLEALAGHLSETHDLLVIEPGNHFETIERLGWASRAELDRIAAGELVRQSDNIFRTRLFTGGIPAGIDRAAFQGRSDALEVLDGLIARHYGRDASVVHWVYKPDQAVRLREGTRFVYEVYDEYTMNFGTGEVYDSVADMESVALGRAEHVFFTSQPLLDRKSARARAFSLVGNGVASEVFARYRVEGISGPGRPVAGYLGNLAAFFDWPLMLDVCRGLPGVDFVFHGQIELGADDPRRATYEQMKGLPNVTFSGRVSRTVGAAAINRYDVLVIPFVVNEAMHAVNPLKLWEYFATGLPVVSSPMDAVTEAPELLQVARTVDEWITALRAAIAGSDARSAAARIARAEAHRWSCLTSAHAAVVRILPSGHSRSVSRVGSVGEASEAV